jgi:2-oxoglutarate ferredoxin oxidoreductase subunit beta
MTVDLPVRQYELDEYKSDEKPTWCPGCGDFGVLNAVYRAMRTRNFAPHEVVAVSGIGCSSRIPYFISTYGFHSVHGRATPVATGVHVARPELKTLVFSGDGDAFAIGAGHVVHAMRRNLDLTYVIMDNAIYGLTKGQTSPTSGLGFHTATTPAGNPEQALNPLSLAITCGATFVARGFSAEPAKLADLILEGLDHKGFSFIDVYSPCPTFNKVNTFKTYKDEVEWLPSDYDATNAANALVHATADDKRYLGVFLRREAPTYAEQVQKSHSGTEADRAKVLGAMFKRYS